MELDTAKGTKFIVYRIVMVDDVEFSMDVQISVSGWMEGSVPLDEEATKTFLRAARDLTEAHIPAGTRVDDLIRVTESWAETLEPVDIEAV